MSKILYYFKSEVNNVYNHNHCRSLTYQYIFLKHKIAIEI